MIQSDMFPLETGVKQAVNKSLELVLKGVENMKLYLITVIHPGNQSLFIQNVQ